MGLTRAGTRTGVGPGLGNVAGFMGACALCQRAVMRSGGGWAKPAFARVDGRRRLVHKGCKEKRLG